ncbi:hypothetical protein GCM10009681_07890 [Luedemannella helvata]|uniref:Uncharacterized protein n=1 Tax=Luedemannella helvata TaxID=349315 RepID=A0ABN2JUM8_9ACTN
MAGVHDADVRAGEGPEQGVHLFAGNGEQHLDALVDQLLDDVVSDVHLWAAPVRHMASSVAHPIVPVLSSDKIAVTGKARGTRE